MGWFVNPLSRFRSSEKGLKFSLRAVSESGRRMQPWPQAFVGWVYEAVKRIQCFFTIQGVPARGFF